MLIRGREVGERGATFGGAWALSCLSDDGMREVMHGRSA